MMVGKAIGLIGILIELAGFALLAAELLRTNRDVVAYAKSLAGNITKATTIIGYESPNGAGLEFTGGSVGELAPAASRLASQVESGARKTYAGLVLTAVGVVGQFIGALMG